MLELAVAVRCLQFYTHHAHHVCARAVFFQDHEFLGEVYSKMDGDYDNIIERFIGINGDANFDEQAVLSAAVQKCSAYSVKGVKENKEFFVTTIVAIKEINAKIEALCKVPGTTQGTIQLIGDIANSNEILLYKLNQRVK